MEYDREYIDIVEWQRIPYVVELKDAFEVRSDRPAVWLQRLCCWMLAKLGAYSSKDTVEIQRHHFGKRGQRFMTELFKRRSAIQGSFEFDPTRLLIGSEDYAELMQEAVSSRDFSFEADYYKGKRTVMGMTVEVIPWMRGMLLLR